MHATHFMYALLGNKNSSGIVLGSLSFCYLCLVCLSSFLSVFHSCSLSLSHSLSLSALCWQAFQAKGGLTIAPDADFELAYAIFFVGGCPWGLRLGIGLWTRTFCFDLDNKVKTCRWKIATTKGKIGKIGKMQLQLQLSLSGWHWHWQCNWICTKGGLSRCHKYSMPAVQGRSRGVATTKPNMAPTTNRASSSYRSLTSLIPSLSLCGSFVSAFWATVTNQLLLLLLLSLVPL